jgi:hypothetical protein
MGMGWANGLAILLSARANQAVIDQDSMHALRFGWRSLSARPFVRAQGFLFVDALGCMGARNHAS